MRWKARRRVRRFGQSDALGASGEIESNDVCAKLNNTGELEGLERERKRVGE